VTIPDDSAEDAARSPSASRGSFVRDVLPALVWTAAVFVLGSIPNPGPSPDLPIALDKFEHAIAFGILQVLALRALRYELPGILPRGMPWIAAASSTVVGAALELYQLSVPNRSAELMDLVWDAIGAGIAATITARLASRTLPPPRQEA
jgi:VanZ family protein